LAGRRELASIHEVALSGMIDFDQADLNDSKWRSRLLTAVWKMNRDKKLRWLEAVLGNVVSARSSFGIDPQDYDRLSRRAQNLTDSIYDVLFPGGAKELDRFRKMDEERFAAVYREIFHPKDEEGRRRRRRAFVRWLVSTGALPRRTRRSRRKPPQP
jgi:hypothetical protein